ncbi:MAG: ABC transporter ATP-binding protein [Nitrososphaerota archaeon]|nr:ABC transporter ATP-binding protein [Nitrososphaerota archaeon]MDG7023625.1 ABC transporter ATP-binding protein [Nitrososphaerota archaeon]
MLQDVNFQLEEGAVGAIVGPSGSGKTTLLNILSGVLSPDSGEIYVDGTLVERAGDGGKDTLHAPPSGRNVGYVFQDYLLFPHMSVFENVAYGLKARHVPDRTVTAAVLEMLDTLGLRDLREKRPGQISGGQMQRVALGRALVLNPRVLLMDEPLSALDWQTRETLRSELRRVFDQFMTTVVYVTHDLDEAFYFGHKIGVLGSGKLAPLGTRDEILGTMSSSTARFFGFNLMRAKFLRSDGPITVFSAAEWGGQIGVELVRSHRLAPDQDVLLAFSPTAIRLNPPRSGPEPIRTSVLDVRQFRDTVQIVVGEPPLTVVAEVPAHEFGRQALKRGDVVTLSIATAWAVSDA